MVDAISSLSHQPLPQGVKRIINQENTYRIRVGNYRVLYEIKKDTVLIAKIDRRETAYS
ncbi:TPA: type II toxin-antitoxin system RelE/ParE family toxin [Candidatus Woesearchaeota archaeon]|nr:type II toxin-antitoxin system RelE/ParE family toxin [Candidatus Woesearchaeota archaeon]HIH49643.1 type II toxin-antitoxin system RelE/ParE family toxin [Candidatus Woesearchaeota archaeon]HIJ03121.1 type II toxin-antitoxin system RelE/ParE family toxin [Candidatus Woesearchaeota archaeon]